MENLLKVLFLLTIYFTVETENHVIRSKKSHTKRMAKAATMDQEAASSMNVTLHFRNLRRKDSEDSIENDSDDLSSYPHYKFAYKVYDPETGDDKEHEESRDGELVQGEYSFIEPDGSRRIVRYTSNGTEGFNAVVTKLKAPTDTEIQQSQELNTQQDYSEASASSANGNESSHQDTEQNHETSGSVQDETKKHSHETHEALTSLNLDIINVENTTDVQEENVNTPAKRSEESALKLQRKFDYLSAEAEQNPAQKAVQKQSSHEKSRKRSVLKESNNTTEPQYIKYMIAIPQNFYIPVNSNKEEVVSNYKENLKSAVKKQKKPRESREISSFYLENKRN